MSKATDIYFTLNNGKKIPGLGLGTVSGPELQDTKSAVKTAVKAGIRHLDTAWYYGTEKTIGEALKELFDEGVVKREDLFITTKVWPVFHKTPEKSLDISLADLGLDYVDLLLQHWPISLRPGTGAALAQAVPRDEFGSLDYDDAGSFIETYRKLEKIYKEGTKVRSIGVSNYSIPLLQQLLSRCTVVPVTNQIESHPSLPQKELVEFCEKHKVLITAYSPNGSGGAPVLQLPLIKELAEKYEVSTNAVANSYHLVSGRSVIPRSTNTARIESFVELAPLTADEIDQLYQLGEEDPRRYINDDFGFGLGFQYWEGDELSPKAPLSPVNPKKMTF